MEARSLKWECQRGRAPLRGSEEDAFSAFASFWLYIIRCITLTSLARSHDFPSVCSPLVLFYKVTVNGFKNDLISRSLILSVMLFLQTRSYVQGSGDISFRQSPFHQIPAGEGAAWKSELAAPVFIMCANDLKHLGDHCLFWAYPVSSTQI